MREASLLPSAHGTIWYMGVKTRLLPFLESAIRPLLRRAQAAAGRPPVVLDLFTGTGAVAAHLCGKAEVHAGDAQGYAVLLAQCALEASPPPWEVLRALEEVVEPAAASVRAGLRERFARDLRAEARFVAAPVTERDLAAARAAGSRPLADEPEELALRLRREGLPGLACAYWGGVYFGVAQAIELDALRHGIARLEERSGRTSISRRLLAALLFVASRATSATAHFAQPRALARDTEVRAMWARRALPIPAYFRARLEAAATECAAPLVPGRAVLGTPASVLAALADRPIDVVYADPPYTADNYSRFYHVLETLLAYDYPALKRSRAGITKGRYPIAESRFQSPFTHQAGVRPAFEEVTALAASRGAALVWSYATSGLFVALHGGGEAGIAALEALCRRHYRRVTVRRVALSHSGAGDKSLAVEELLFICTGARNACAT